MKNLIRNCLLGVFFAALVPIALAAIATVNATKAVENTDGTAIPATGAGSISSVTVEYGLCGPGDVFATKTGEINVTAGPTATPNLAPGRWCFRAVNVNTYGVTSDYSPTAVKVIGAPKPNPPGAPTVN